MWALKRLHEKNWRESLRILEFHHSPNFSLNSCSHSGISEFNELPRSIAVSSGCPVGEEDEAEEDDEESLSCLEGVFEVDEDPEDELDRPGTTIGTKFAVLQSIRIPFLMRCGF